MHMTRQDLPATKSGTDLLAMLTKATQEGKAAAADLCSTRLKKVMMNCANAAATSSTWWAITTRMRFAMLRYDTRHLKRIKCIAKH